MSRSPTNRQISPFTMFSPRLFSRRPLAPTFFICVVHRPLESLFSANRTKQHKKRLIGQHLQKQNGDRTDTERTVISSRQLNSPSSRGQPFARAHSTIGVCPAFFAQLMILASQGQWCALAHLSTSRCPPRAAALQVSSFLRGGGQHQEWVALRKSETPAVQRLD